MLLQRKSKFSQLHEVVLLNQVDVRLSKRIHIGRARVMGMLDVYNLFNASTITAVNTRYGPAWLQPLAILPARLFKVGAQLDF